MKKKLVALFVIMTLLFTSVEAGVTVNAKSNEARHAKVEGVASQGNTICVSTSKGIYAVNKKTSKKKLLTSKKKTGHLLIYKGYLYYGASEKNKMNTYKVKLSGGKSKLVIENAEVDFVQNGRLFYFKEGICSANRNGKAVKTHLSIKGASGETCSWGEVCYYKNRYYYQYNYEQTASGDVQDSTGYGSGSVNKNFKGNKNCKSYYDIYCKAFDSFNSGSSVTSNQKTYFTDEYPYIQSYKGNKKYIVYTSHKKYVMPCGAGDGYILLKEGNKRKKKQFRNLHDAEKSIIGNYRIISTSGKSIAVIK